MPAQIDALCDAMKTAGMKAAKWDNRRIYINGYGRDIKAYVQFDEPWTDADECTGPMGLWAGCALKVYSDSDQSRQWLINRAKQVKHEIMLALADAEIILGDVCITWQEVGL